MKVAMIDPSLFTARYDDGLCEAIAARGHDVTLLGRPMRSTDAIVPKRYRYEARFFSIGERLRPLLGEGKIGQAAKALDYAIDVRVGSLKALAGDIAHFQWLPFAPADARLLRRLRDRVALVHTVHNAQPFHGDSNAQGRGYGALLTQFDTLIVHGEQTRDALLAQGLEEERIHIVQHPPMRLREAAAEDVAAVPKPNCPRILFFGTIRPYKGLDLLVQACLTLWREGLDFELAISGKPFMPVEAFLGAIQGGGLGDRLITDLGFLTEHRLDAHLRAADILAFPYRAIDSSGAFLSALRYGAAMVTSDAGMFGEIPQDVASRFPAGDAQALTEKLRSLLLDEGLREARGRAALAYGAAMDGWDRAAEQTEHAYLDAIARFEARI
ncbi:glycosyltransferase family 4 protein [Sphingobium nicotianae]|uniref:Glycosyltransferase family 4 protein n=1 Tax=Sphingobium nicotianae TaxID=2782607 RepID=A0A9X1AJ12_9SPHN|nr:glycosyltransferase family 4 protein [Sphingobium nicotianae]MBT2185714.1 glycosyltransferase family 4 protein [Sphingobium nicotianae]